MNLIPPLFASLAKLDPTNDDHWTADGQARVDVVSAAAGEALNRQDIIDAAPTFTRATAPEIMAEYRAAFGNLPPAVPKAAPAPTQEPQSAKPVDTRPSAPEPAPAATAPPVPPSESVLKLPVAELMSSVDLLERALVELNQQSQAKLAERAAIDVQLKGIYAESEVCTRALSRIKPKDNPASAVQNYLRRSQQAREERARRAQAFLKQGTTAKDVVEQLRGPSKLDVAMSQRKPAPGSTRPAPRSTGA